MGACVSSSLKIVLQAALGEKAADDAWAKRISQITDHLLVSGLPAVASYHVTCDYLIEQWHVGAVVNCVKGQRRPAQINGRFAYLHLPLEDNDRQNLDEYFTELFEFLDHLKDHPHRNNNNKVLIVCQYGISRSAAIALAYLMYVDKMPLRQAYQTLKAKRPVSCPNMGFFRQLIQLETQLRRAESVKILEPFPKLYCLDLIWEEILEEAEQIGKGH